MLAFWLISAITGWLILCVFITGAFILSGRADAMGGELGTEGREG